MRFNNKWIEGRQAAVIAVKVLVFHAMMKAYKRLINDI